MEKRMPVIWTPFGPLYGVPQWIPALTPEECEKLEADVDSFLHPKKDPYEEMAHALVRATVK